MYQDPKAAQNPFANPWTTDQSQLQNMERAQPAPTPDASLYPSYPNSYGLGSGDPNSGADVGPKPDAGASGQGYFQAPVTVQTPDTTSRGMSPWSLMGEANARQGQQP